MTLPASGAISLSQVNQELGRASPYNQTVSLGDSAVRSLFAVASGAISMSNGYGRTFTTQSPPTLVGSTYTQSASGTSFTQTVPAGATGNLLLLIIVSPVTANLPAGWTQLADFANANLITLICYKTATAASESDFTVSISTGWGAQTIGTAIYRFSGANQTPVASTQSAFNYGTAGNASYTEITGGLGSDYYLQYFHATIASVSFAAPSGSSGSLLSDTNATAPSFASFYRIGNGSAGSSAFTQAASSPIRGGQIRIAAA